MQLPLAPFLSSPSNEWPDGDKTQQQPPQEVQPLGVGTERRILSDPLFIPLCVSVCVCVCYIRAARRVSACEEFVWCHMAKVGLCLNYCS